MLTFDKKYRRLLHAELDELLDASEAVYVGSEKHLQQNALHERVARKWAFDEMSRAHSGTKYGKVDTVRALKTSIETYEKLIRRAEDSPNECYKLAIGYIENFIAKLDE